MTLDIQYVYSRADSVVDYDFASAGAFYNVFPLAEVGTGFPEQEFEHQLLQIGLDWQLRDDLDLRLTYRFEKEDLDDFHYRGLTDPVVGNAIYLAAFPEDFSAHAVGVFLQKSF